MTPRVLVLGGTAEARALASRLVDGGYAVTTSLAGRTRHPRLPSGEVRTGGFGGIEGLAAALDDVDVLVDATHPFAAAMTEHAAAAAARTATPLVVLRRPGWTAGAGDRWTRVPSLEAAAAAIPAGARVLLATGRQGVGAFLGVDAWFLVRAIEAPDALPPRAEVVLARGPFALDDERALLDRRRIDVVVAKDSGGATEAKLVAARERRLPVLLVDRPPLPPGVEAVESVGEVLVRLDQLAP
ncbi:cobalt-precorrin-6A reductase [Actinomycetospora cinnamomea]|uniref:Precorrin-6A/cobalt-precorrin-6A reductase n=1 Tax=Actinomycetospora cinnamomea TaxID=663609 RepID=A0A2U1E8A2_9PSEU|nr:cobalt-precorrin-6A reductase [Actinomycetospora cinnamomea]PVY96177.1 precorrin-6A/cobalt-precorrin-6A reductase [Actinomycetospora cinnamomea]